MTHFDETVERNLKTSALVERSKILAEQVAHSCGLITTSRSSLLQLPLMLDHMRRLSAILVEIDRREKLAGS